MAIFLSFFTPGDIFWPLHISFSLPQLVLLFPYMAISPDVVTPHIYQIWHATLNEQLLWLNTFGGIPCVTSALCCFLWQRLDNAESGCHKKKKKQVKISISVSFFLYASVLFGRSLSVWRLVLVVAHPKKRKPLSSNLWASRMPSPSLSPLSATASARPKPSLIAPNVATAMAPLSVAYACATQVA